MPLKVQASLTRRRKFDSSQRTRPEPPSMIVSSDGLAVGGANAAIGIKLRDNSQSPCIVSPIPPTEEREHTTISYNRNLNLTTPSLH